MKDKKVLIVGAGPAGAASARKLAEAGYEVHVYDKRPHVGGNCYDEYDEQGVLIHRYGPHYFRTNSHELLKWLSCFTDWIPARYYVRSKVGDILVPMPVSLSSITALKGNIYSKHDFENYLKAERCSFPEPRNAEEQCLALVGRELYEVLFKEYTKKQWGVEATKLSPSITARIPLRFNWDERYPTEEYQVMPKYGYSHMFSRMLDHPNITVKTNSLLKPHTISQLRNDYDCTIYTGPIDTFFNFRYGKLGYRSLRFEWLHFEECYVQPCVQINYPSDFEYTRTVEIKHVTGQDCKETTICYEYPESHGEPFYPILTTENQEKYVKYKLLADKESARNNPIFFLGRLAEFKYYNMDHVFIRSIEHTNHILKFA
jgi:UDP-galactopyranose mutase